MAAPMAGELIVNILDYLGYRQEGTARACLPDLTGLSPAQAKAALTELGLEARTVGEGAVVAGQIPAPGTAVPQGGGVVLTLGAGEDADQAAFLSLRALEKEEPS